ncbi:MAG TPA: MarR family winged helix-turn-helix transcriptional regulator [Candidatus Nanopelagicales bacterium]
MAEAARRGVGGDADLLAIDAALLGLRHLWSAPPERRAGRPLAPGSRTPAAPGSASPDGAARAANPGRGPLGTEGAAGGRTADVELSTVWIVDALTRAEAAGRPSMTVRDLAEALDVAHSTASRLLDRAEATGTVKRGRSPADARSVACSLTPLGRDLAAESAAFRTDYLAHLTADWTADERASFGRLLTRFAEAARARPPDPDPGAGCQD